MRFLSKIFMISLLTFVALNLFALNAPAAENKILRMAVAKGDIRSMDPQYGVTTSDLVAIDIVYNALLRFPRGQVTLDMKKIQGDLAEKWDESSDGLVWTFYLRKGVKFHKGYGELTSEDVKFSLEKAKDPNTSAFHSSYKQIDKIEIPDKYTVKITLKENVPTVLTMLGNWHGGFIVSKKAFLEKGDQFKFDPIGTGPFIFQSYTPREKAVFSRNPDYFEGKPTLDGLELWLMPETATREMAFEAGKVDIIEGIREQSWVNKMMKIPGTVIDAFGPGDAAYLFFNVTQKPFDDIRVRKAISYGISRDELLAFLGKNLAVAMDSPVPPNYWGYASKLPSYPFDPQKAKQLLKEAGYPNGFTQEIVMTEATDYRRIAEQVQAQLKRIGVDMKLSIVGHSTYHTRIKSDANAPMSYMHSFTLPIADALLWRYWHSAAIIGKPNQDVNLSHYDKVDKEIEMAGKELNLEKQMAYWAEAQRKIMEDAACVPLVVANFPFARKKHVNLGYNLEDSMTVCPNIIWKTDIVK